MPVLLVLWNGVCVLMSELLVGVRWEEVTVQLDLVR